MITTTTTTTTASHVQTNSSIPVTGTARTVPEAIDALLEVGKKRGYVTWEEMNEILPDNAVNPNQLEKILMRIPA